ncbi:MAG: C40 family peptidase [Acidimicrobiales bacterium]
MSRGRYFTRRFAAVAAATSMAVSTVAVLSNAGPAAAAGPTAGQISTLQQRADALAAQLTADENKIQVAAEAYDEAVVALGIDRARLQRTEAHLASLRQSLAHAQVHLRNTAINAYVTDNGAAADLAVLNGSASNAGSIAAYAGSVTDQLQNAEYAIVVAKDRVAATVVVQTAEERSAAKAVAAAARAKQAAETETSQVSAILSEVKGRLATLIIEHERAVAAAAAARARKLRREQEAAAAAQEAAAAEQAAGTAGSVAGSDPTPGNNAGAGDAQGSAGNTGEGQPLVPAGSNSAGNAALKAAESFLGVPYVWGGASRQGVDCSGLTMLAWAAAGVSLEHGATAQYAESTHLAPSQIEPGDLIFYHFANDGPWPITHVAMYVGSGPYGTQTIIQAAETGTNVAFYPMYWDGFVGVGRP